MSVTERLRDEGVGVSYLYKNVMYVIDERTEFFRNKRVSVFL